MIQNILLTIIIILIVLIIILLLGIFYFIFYRNKSQNQVAPVVMPPPQVEIVESAPLIDIEEGLERCILHPNTGAEAMCVICDQYFCKTCLKLFNNHHLCPSHLKLFLSANWIEIKRVESNSEQPELGVTLVESKKRIWNESRIAMYLETQYKIDVDADQITSFLVLFSEETSREEILKKLN